MDPHHAPAVRYPVRRCALHGLAIALLALLLASTGLTWLLQSAPPVPTRLHLLYAVLAAAVLAWAARDWWRTPAGHLGWDGAAWYWDGDEAAGAPAAALRGETAARLAVHLDGQSWLLLSLQTTGAPRRWLLLQRHTDPPRWRALRCAVVALGGVADAPREGTP